MVRFLRLFFFLGLLFSCDSEVRVSFSEVQGLSCPSSASVSVSPSIVTKNYNSDIEITVSGVSFQEDSNASFGGINCLMSTYSSPVYDCSLSATLGLGSNLLTLGDLAGGVSECNFSSALEVLDKSYHIIGTADSDYQWYEPRTVQGSDGSLYIVNSTDGDLAGSVGDSDIVVVKVNTNGKLEWKRQYGSTQFDVAKEVVIDDKDNVYILGSTNGGSFEGEANIGGWDVVVLKVDKSGNKVFQRQLGSVGSDSEGYIHVNSSKEVFISAYGSGSFEGEAAIGNADMVAIKLNADGTTAWVRQVGSIENDMIYISALDVNSNFYIVGQARNGGDFEDGTSRGGNDVAVAKFASDGTEVYATQFGSAGSDGPDSDYYTYDTTLQVDSAGNLYLGIQSNDGVEGEAHLGGQDIVFIKVGPTGNLDYVYQTGSTGVDWAGHIYIDNTGNLYGMGQVVGAFEGEVSIGGRDIAIIKLDASGNKVYSRILGSVGNEFPQQGEVLSDGSFLIVGKAGGDFEGESSLGGDDIFTIKLKPDGSTDWVKQLGSSANDNIFQAKFFEEENKVLFLAEVGSGASFEGETSQGGDDLVLADVSIGNGSLTNVRQLGGAENDYGFFERPAIFLKEDRPILVGWVYESLYGETYYDGGQDFFVQFFNEDLSDIE